MCGSPGPQPVTDWARGDVVCCGCGVVLEGQLLADTPDWDNSNNNGHGHGHSHGQHTRGHPNKRRKLVACDEEAPLLAGRQVVDAFVARFGQSTSSNVAGTARQLYTDVHAAKKQIRGADARSAAAAAAVYFGFKFEGVGREMHLVAGVCEVALKALHAAVSEYKDVLRDRPYYPKLFTRLHVGMLLDVCIDRLRLAAAQRKALWRTAHRLDEQLSACMDCGRKPKTLCSGVMWLAAHQEGIAVDKKDVAAACLVCPQTVDKIAALLRSQL